MRLLIKRVEDVLMFMAVVCVCAMTFIVSWDASARYLFNDPLPWAQEVVSYYLMVIATYFALSSTFRHGDHVSIDLITVLLPKRIQVVIEVIVSLLAALVFLIITCAVFGEVAYALEQRLHKAGYIMWPVWLSYAPIAIGAAVFVLRLLFHCYSLLRFGFEQTENNTTDTNGVYE